MNPAFPLFFENFQAFWIAGSHVYHISPFLAQLACSLSIRGKFPFSFQRLPLNPRFKRSKEPKFLPAAKSKPFNRTQSAEASKTDTSVLQTGRWEERPFRPFRWTQVNLFGHLWTSHSISLTEFAARFAELYLKEIKAAQSRKLHQENQGNVRTIDWNTIENLAALIYMQ